jgi:hypothetical protein
MEKQVRRRKEEGPKYQVLPREESDPGKPILARRVVTHAAKRRRAG